MVDNRFNIQIVNNFNYRFLLTTYYLVMITILKIQQTKLGFSIPVLD